MILIPYYLLVVVSVKRIILIGLITQSYPNEHYDYRGFHIFFQKEIS